MHRNLNVEIAGRDHLGGADQAADRGNQPVGEIEPDPGRRKQHDERDHREHQRERDLNAETARFEIGELADALLRRAQLLDDARIEHAGRVEIHVVVAVELERGGDVIALGNKRDLRLGLVDLGEQFRPRQHDLLVHRHVGALHGGAVGPDDDGGGEPARGRLRGEEFLELVAVLVEHLPGAAEIEGHGQNLAADRLGVLADIGVGHDQRLLDHGAGARREETVEAAIKRRRGDHRDEDGRNGGNHGEQADDLHVKPRAGVAAPARLDHYPYFAADDGKEENSGRGVAEQELDHDLVHRRDRGKAGKHQEGRGRGKQRDADRERPDQARGHGHRGGSGRVEGDGGHRCGGGRVERGDLIDSRHGRHETRDFGGTERMDAPTIRAGLMLLYNNVA